MELLARLVDIAAALAVLAVVWRATIAMTSGTEPAYGSLPFVITTALVAVVPMHAGALLGDLRVGSFALAAGCLPFAWRGRQLPNPRPTRAALSAAGLLAVAFAPVALGTEMFDGHCHRPMISAAARGVLPIENPFFAGEPFVYHLGFGGLSAWARVFGGLSATAAIDVATFWLLAALVWVFTDVMRALLAREARTLEVAACIVLHSPLALWGHAVFQLRAPGWSLFPSFQNPDVALPPPVSSFMQHPQSIGLPLAYAAFLVARARDGVRTRVLLALLCLLLSQAHVVFFAVGGLLVGLDALFARRPLEDRLLRVLWLGAAVLGSMVLGGLGASHGGLLVLGGMWGRETPIGMLLHLPVPLAVLVVTALRIARKEAHALEVLLAGGVTIGIVVASVLHYPESWDIVKFYQLATLLAIPLAVRTLAAWHARAPRATLALAAILCVTSALWLARFGVLNGATLPGGRALKHHDEPKTHPIALYLEPWLAEHVGPRDLVITTAPVIGDIGVLVYGTGDPDVIGKGYVLDRVARRAEWKHATLALDRLEPRLLRSSHARFALLPVEMIAERVSPPVRAAYARAAVSSIELEGTPWALFDLEQLAVE